MLMYGICVSVSAFLCLLDVHISVVYRCCWALLRGNEPLLFPRGIPILQP